ncbi:Trafficking protein particle complex subunit 8, partial [Eumeta japonica]
MQAKLQAKQWVENSEEFKKTLPPLALPLIESNATAVLCAGMAPLSSPGRIPATSITLREAETALPDTNKHWHKMEEMLVQIAQGGVPMIFKPTVNLHMSTTDNTTSPIVPQGEPVQISILVYNPLKISLTLKDVELLWQFKGSDESSETFYNELSIASSTSLDCNMVSCQKIKSLVLDGDSKKYLHFAITPLQVGELRLLGLAYKLTSTKTYEDAGNGTVVVGKQYLEITPNKQRKSQALDKRLQICVTPCAPCLQMTFSELNNNLLNGEIQKVDVEFRNVGPMEMKNLYIAVSHPECLCLATSEMDTEEFNDLYEIKYKPSPSNLVSTALAGGECTRASLLLRPTSRTRPLRLLAYYEAGLPPYRLLRHTFTFNVI